MIRSFENLDIRGSLIVHAIIAMTNWRVDGRRLTLVRRRCAGRQPTRATSPTQVVHPLIAVVLLRVRLHRGAPSVAIQ
jgi:hypothetical protein